MAPMQPVEFDEQSANQMLNARPSCRSLGQLFSLRLPELVMT